AGAAPRWFSAPAYRTPVLFYLPDNGCSLPDSKHNSTENGYRTRLFVYDPRTTNPAPPWRAADAVPAPALESPALAHSTDLLPTILGFALGTSGSQACPRSRDGTPCDGRDLRPYLRTATGPAVAAQPLRHSLCGHQTQRGSSPNRQRYLLTRPGSVGRCVDVTLPACTSTAGCAAGRVCIGGHCVPTTESGCSSTAQCPKGLLCLGGRCRVGPPCLDDATCVTAYGSMAVRCTERERKWCRNAPNQPCTTANDCPACPSPVARTAGAPCGPLCPPPQPEPYL